MNETNSVTRFLQLLQAALKQLPKNKVPNMAVLLRSLVHTHGDAKAVFKDPTGRGPPSGQQQESFYISGHHISHPLLV